MSSHDRIRRQQLVLQAEGYLELGMPRHALEVLARYGRSDSLAGSRACICKARVCELGPVSRGWSRWRGPRKAALTNVHIWLALGWCHKRTGRIDLAIEALEEALAVEPNDALIHYNLACYWSLAGNKRQALSLSLAGLRPEGTVSHAGGREPDFDAIRSDPAFQALMRVTV